MIKLFKRPERQPRIVMFDPSKVNMPSERHANQLELDQIRKARLEAIVEIFGINRKYLGKSE